MGVEKAWSLKESQCNKSYISIKFTPNFPEFSNKVTIHKLVIYFGRLLEDLPYDSYEQFNRNWSHRNWIRKEKDSCIQFRATPNRIA